MWKINTLFGRSLASAKKKKEIIIGNNDQEKRIMISSDPANSTISIKYTSDEAGRFNIRIIGLNGYEVFSEEFSQKAGENKIDVDVSRFSEGTYIVESVKQNASQEIISTYNKIDISLAR
jgi:hypothetical protein